MCTTLKYVFEEPQTSVKRARGIGEYKIHPSPSPYAETEMIFALI